jgi:hypothetical protein
VEKCWHIAAQDVAALIARFGNDALVRDVLARSVCGKCGRERARALIRLTGVRGDKAWWPTPAGRDDDRWVTFAAM